MVERPGRTVNMPIDHAILAVADLSKAAQAFAALGFSVTPPMTRSAQMGTANCCIMLEGNCVELISVISATPLNADWRDILAQWGVRGFALRGGDIAAERARLIAAGLPAGDLLAFSRADEGSGSQEVRFRVERIQQAVPADYGCLCVITTRLNVSGRNKSCVIQTVRAVSSL